MERILHRLTAAAADADMRHDMNVEDEYFSIIEKRDTELMQSRRLLAEKDAELSKKDAEMSKKDAEIDRQTEQLRKSVLLLHKSAVPAETIAATLNIGLEDIKQIIE